MFVSIGGGCCRSPERGGGGGTTDLEIEHAWRGSLGDVLAVGLLEESYTGGGVSMRNATCKNEEYENTHEASRDSDVSQGLMWAGSAGVGRVTYRRVQEAPRGLASPATSSSRLWPFGRPRFARRRWT